MSRWLVRGSLTVCCDVEVEVYADDEDEARAKAEDEIRGMDPDVGAVDRFTDAFVEINEIERDDDEGDFAADPPPVSEDQRMRALGYAMLPGVA